MGMDQKVTFAPDRLPSWAALAQLLAERGFPVQMRMIDGELAFPDEAPGANWRELRLSSPGGMVTLRRDPDGITLVTWGNADAALRQAWNVVTWAVAQLSGGMVQLASGALSADEFARSVDLPKG
jgi:hypothetical protein